MTRSRVKNDFSVGIDDGADANAISIDSSEQVGIGTASPSDKLHVYSGSSGGTTAHSYTQLHIEHNSHAAIQISSPASTESVILFADPDDNDIGGVGYYHAQDYLYLRSVGATRLRVDADGIKFGSDSAAANALNDYEEGTWTPAITATSSAVTVYSADYTKIGNVVQIQLYCAWSNNANNNSSVFQITGLPFTHSAGTSYSAVSMGYVGSSNMNDAMAIIPANGSYIYFHQNDGSASTLANSDIHSRGLQVIILSGTYHTDS